MTFFGWRKQPLDGGQVMGHDVYQELPVIPITITITILGMCLKD